MIMQTNGQKEIEQVKKEYGNKGLQSSSFAKW